MFSDENLKSSYMQIYSWMDAVCIAICITIPNVTIIDKSTVLATGTVRSQCNSTLYLDVNFPFVTNSKPSIHQQFQNFLSNLMKSLYN